MGYVMYRFALWTVLSLGVLSSVQAQEQYEPITPENVTQLASVGRVDFADLPPEAGEVINGRVIINDDGSLIAVVNRQSQIVILSDKFDLVYVSDVLLTDDDFPATFIDGNFAIGNRHLFVAVHVSGGAYTISVLDLDSSAETQRYASDDQPVSIWLNAGKVWLEVVPAEPDKLPYLLKFALPLRDSAPVRHPFVPAEDEDTVVRIGRLHPPLAVTVSENAEVKRWNLETGDLTAIAQVAQIPIYGYTTPNGNTLLWRDPSSLALHILDFETGDDQAVVDLDGVYVPFMFLNPLADVIVGAYVDDEPLVAVWQVDTGRYQPLGLYRQCQPDMVRLSADGSTLIIGCDMGLDVWRVRAE